MVVRYHNQHAFSPGTTSLTFKQGHVFVVSSAWALSMNWNITKKVTSDTMSRPTVSLLAGHLKHRKLISSLSPNRRRWTPPGEGPCCCHRCDRCRAPSANGMGEQCALSPSPLAQLFPRLHVAALHSRAGQHSADGWRRPPNPREPPLSPSSLRCSI